MDSFAKKFIEEATDNINDLENALLELDKNPNDKEIIENIFRALHSLKGGGAMFGFDGISSITHELENIYDLIRKDKKDISDDITSLTLETTDHLRNLLADPELENEDNKSIDLHLKSRISNLAADKPTSNQVQQEEKITESKLNTYYILFQPTQTILQNGTNPLYLIDELCELGENLIIPHYSGLIETKKFNPEYCYVFWELYLVTSKNIDAINEVFLFVESDSAVEIQILANDNILTDLKLVDKINKAISKGNETTINTVKTYLQTKRADQNKKASALAKGEQKISSIRVNSDKLDNLMNLVSELVTTQAQLSLFAEDSSDSALVAIAENVQKLTRQLRDTAFDIVLIPIDTIVMRFQRLVRDLAKNLNKKVDLVTKGTDTELDKTLIENLVDPIMHIIRNNIDHGIETVEERKKAGKSETGKISLTAYYSGVNVHIDISDDGAGIDKEKLYRKAVERELITDGAEISDHDLYQFIFYPGFSTATVVTDVSGRGVGMDVVKRKINQVRGEVNITSERGIGTTMSIVIPITLSIIDGLLIRIDRHHFILPMVVIDKIFSIKHDETKQSQNDLIILDGEQVPFIHLRSSFKLPGEAPEYEEVIIATYNDKKVGLIADSVVGEYQAVLKPLGKQFKDQDYISGASILGDGRIALVLDTNKMIKRFDELKKEERFSTI